MECAWFKSVNNRLSRANKFQYTCFLENAWMQNVIEIGWKFWPFCFWSVSFDSNVFEKKRSKIGVLFLILLIRSETALTEWDRRDKKWSRNGILLIYLNNSDKKHSSIQNANSLSIIYLAIFNATFGDEQKSLKLKCLSRRRRKRWFDAN